MKAYRVQWFKAGVVFRESEHDGKFDAMAAMHVSGYGGDRVELQQKVLGEPRYEVLLTAQRPEAP